MTSVIHHVNRPAAPTLQAAQPSPLPLHDADCLIRRQRRLVSRRSSSKFPARRLLQTVSRCSAAAEEATSSAAPAESAAESEINSQAEAAGPLVQQLNAEELEVAISERDRPLVIDFFATWCGPCLLLAKELEKVAEELGNAIRIVKVDTDKNPMLSSQLEIQGLPTMVFVSMDKEKPALRTEGLLPAAVIKEIIQNEL